MTVIQVYLMDMMTLFECQAVIDWLVVNYLHKFLLADSVTCYNIWQGS